MSATEVDRLARFRADPSKVRVSVRRHGDEVSLCIQSRAEPLRGVDALNIPLTHGDIESAMDRLLERADGYVEGIDLGMERVYKHPMRTA